MDGARVPRLSLLLLVTLLVGCETAYKDGQPNERSPEFWVPVGSRLVLHRSIEVPAGQGSAYLQDGELLRWYDVNQYAPYCALAVEAIRWDAAQRVAADEFVVRKVSQRFLFTLAGAPRLLHARRDDNDGMTYEVLATVMEIGSARQPEVRALTCASWTLPQGRSNLTVEQIRRALGAYVTLELKSGSEPG
jgi:hypothetical protein